ncbi:MAG TPA: amidohydrolase family protein [Pseudolabrys sp.]|nr:amidohydrolase family protein [Pseudolabrys sp.]
MKLLLVNADVLPGGDDWQARRADILIDGVSIAAMAPKLAAPADAQVIDASALIVMPAFINAHTHSPEMLGRALAPMAEQAEWLAVAYGDGRDALAGEDIARAIRLCAADLVRGGAVGVTDHFRQVPMRAEAVHAAAQAWAATGLDARIALNLRDRVSAPSAGPAMSTEAVLALARDLMDADLPVPVAPGASAPQRASDRLLTGLFALSRERASPLHMHLCETAADAAACRALYGVSAVAHLDRLGVLGPQVELAHAVHVDAGDLDIIAARGASIVHNPVANLRLGSGVAPVARALRAGVNVRLGTDGAGSNDTQSMLEAAKFALLAPRAAMSRGEWPTPEQVLRMATAGAVLAPGQPANLLAFDAAASAFLGAESDPAPHIVLAAREADIVHVIGRGRFLMRNRRLEGVQ